MPGNIVGAIANEADLDSKHIGRINIYDDYSTVDLPEGMPGELLKTLRDVRVSGQRINISKMTDQKTRTGDKPVTAKPAREKTKLRHRDKKNKGKPKRARQKVK